MESGIEENAAERKFGPQFDDIHILSNAQVAVILQVSAGQATQKDEELNEVYRKTQKYVERFNQMANKEKDHQGKCVGNMCTRTNEYYTIHSKITHLLLAFCCFLNLELVEELDNLQDALTTFRKETDDGEELELHGFEVAALMNLVIADTTVEEACALIPSLSRLPEAAIDEIIDLIKSTMLRIIS